MKKLLMWLMETKAWSILLLDILPYVRFSFYYTRFTGEQFAEAYKILKPGQFILALDEKKLTSFLVPGFTTHATFVVNNCQKTAYTDYEIGEMCNPGYCKSYLFTICKEASRILICDCSDWNDAHKQRMIDATKRFYKASYAVDFSLGIRALYCSELVYQLDRIATNPQISDVDLSDDKIKGTLQCDLSDIEGLGRPYISPDGLLFAKNTRVLWDSDGALTGLTGPRAEEVCKQLKLI